MDQRSLNWHYQDTMQELNIIKQRCPTWIHQAWHRGNHFWTNDCIFNNTTHTHTPWSHHIKYERPSSQRGPMGYQVVVWCDSKKSSLQNFNWSARLVERHHTILATYTKLDTVMCDWNLTKTIEELNQTMWDIRWLEGSLNLKTHQSWRLVESKGRSSRTPPCSSRKVKKV